MEFLLFIGCGVLLIYLMFKRIENEKEEHFEDRDN